MLEIIAAHIPSPREYEQGDRLISDSAGQRSRAQGQFLHDNKEREFLSVLSSCQLG